MNRLTDFLLDASPHAALDIGDLLMQGMYILKNHPLVGRKVEEGYRKLVISHGRNGYIALYRYVVVTETALVLAIRHQRELGYSYE